jgi:enoyl-CoA hydratase/carnithine racemase
MRPMTNTPAPTDEPLARTEIHDAVGELIINRPERRNALTSDTVTALHQGLDALIAAPEVKVILIRGEGDVFTAGVDLKVDRTPDHFDRWRAFHAAIYACPRPIVGALQRYAIAGGSALALACDFLIAGDTARIDTSEVRMGMAAPINTVWLELKWGVAVGYRFALAGQPVTGPELVTLGVAVKSVPDGDVLEEARAYAATLAENDAWAMTTIKRGTQHLRGIEGAAAFEDRVTAVQCVQQAVPRG